MPKTGRVLPRLAGLCAVLILAGCSQSEPPAKRPTLRVGIALQPSTVVPLVAAEKGYADTELDIQVKTYPSGKLALKGLFAGEVDLAVGVSEVPLVFASFERKDFRILATTVSADSIQRIVARRDAGIQKPADLRGKRIATQRGSAVHYYMSQFLAKHGMTEADLTVSFMKGVDLPKALAEGRIDAFSMREPFVSQARSLLGENCVVFADKGVYFTSEHIVGMADGIAGRETELQAYLKALLEAHAFVADRPDEAQAIVAKQIGAPKEKVAELWPALRVDLRLNQSLLSELEEEAQWARRAELVGKVDAIPNYIDLLHLDSLQAVKPEAVTVFR